MSDIISQVSYPVFLACVFLFFLLVSIFSFVVGVGLALRNPLMLHFYSFMNRGFSVRRLLRPLFTPHHVEPVLHRHLKLLGSIIIVGAAASIFMLVEVDAVVFQPVFLGSFSNETAEILANYTRSFLLAGNVICVAVGLLALFFPGMLSKIEAYTDQWYSLRKQMRPLNQVHTEVDNWVLAHPTVSGITLSIMSLILAVSMYANLSGLPGPG
jgi:hypothetical protein